MKSERGSITLFVLIAMIFFVTIAFTAYVSATSKLQGQNDEFDKIKASYGQNLTEEGLASLYEDIANKCTVKFISNILPEEYQEVEYIESTGTQWIDTGVFPLLEMGFKTKFSIKQLQGNQSPISCQKSSYLAWGIIIGTIGENYQIASGNGSWYDGWTGIFATANKNYDVEYNYLNSSMTKINNENVVNLRPDRQVPSENVIKIFSGTPTGTTMNGKIHRVFISKNENVIHDFVPSYQKINNTIGMYDIENGQFYTNAGTGTFEKGNYTSTVVNGTMENQKFVYGKPQNLRLNTYNRDGYTFAGWNTKEDGTGTAYTDGQEISINMNEEKVIKLYAQWRKN